MRSNSDDMLIADTLQISELESITLTITNTENYHLTGPLKPSKSKVALLQFYFLLCHYFQQKIENWPIFATKVACTITFSLVVAFLWFQLSKDDQVQRLKVITLHTLYFTAQSNLGAFRAFFYDRRERLRGADPQSSTISHRNSILNNNGIEEDQNAPIHFNTTIAWVAKFTSELPDRLFLVLLSVTIVFPIVGLSGGVAGYLLYVAALSTQGLANCAFGLNVGALCKNSILGSMVASSIFAFNYIWSGIPYTSDRPTWILKWLRYFSVSFYANQLVIWGEFWYAGNDSVEDDWIDQWFLIDYWAAWMGLWLLVVLYSITGILLLHLTTRKTLFTR